MNRDKLNESGIDSDVNCWKGGINCPKNPSRNWKKIGKLLAAGIRQMAMETLGDTKMKKSESRKEEPGKKRSGREAIEFLKERTKLDYDLRKAEFEPKKRNEAILDSTYI